MVIVYTNSVPICTTYTNIGHLYRASDLKPTEIYINFWDNYAIKHPLLQNLDREVGMKEIYKVIDDYERLVFHIGMKNKKILFTDASNRLLKDRVYYSLFEEISSKIALWNIMKEFEVGRSIEYKSLTLSNIFNIILDYLVCIFIEDLYPEKGFRRPDIYFTSERFRPFFPVIEKIFRKEYPQIKLPYPHYVSFPFILCPVVKKLPEVGMEKKEIANIIRNYIKLKNLKSSEIEELISIFSRVLDSFNYRNSKLNSTQFAMKMKVCENEEIISYLSTAFVDYHSSISKIIKEKKNSIEESIAIIDVNEYIKKIKPLNIIKIKILKLCNGNNSVNDISNILKLNKNTTAIYITQLKKSRMITNESCPRRITDHITLNLRELG